MEVKYNPAVCHTCVHYYACMTSTWGCKGYIAKDKQIVQEKPSQTLYDRMKDYNGIIKSNNRR